MSTGDITYKRCTCTAQDAGNEPVYSLALTRDEADYVWIVMQRRAEELTEEMATQGDLCLQCEHEWSQNVADVVHAALYDETGQYRAPGDALDGEPFPSEPEMIECELDPIFIDLATELVGLAEAVTRMANKLADAIGAPQ